MADRAAVQRRTGRGEEATGGGRGSSTAGTLTHSNGPGYGTLVGLTVPILFVGSLVAGFLSSGGQAPQQAAVVVEQQAPSSPAAWRSPIILPPHHIPHRQGQDHEAHVDNDREELVGGVEVVEEGEQMDLRWGDIGSVTGAAGGAEVRVAGLSSQMGPKGAASSGALLWASSAHKEREDKQHAEQQVVAVGRGGGGASGGTTSGGKGKLAKGQPRLAPLLEFSTEGAGDEAEAEAALDPINATPADGKLRLLEGGVVHALLSPHTSRAKANHASTLLLLPSGELACAWFWGEEGESQVAIVMASLKRGAREWTDLRLVSVQTGRSAQNPVLFMENSTSMVLVHTSQLAGRGQGTAEVRVLKSMDGGYSWTPPRLLFKESGAMVRNPPIPSMTNPGEMLLPLYYTPSGMGAVRDQYSVMKWSTNPGASWPQAKTARISTPGQGLVQPAVVRLPGGRILAFLRDRLSRGIYCSSSEDDGRNWKTPKPTGLPNNNKAVMAALLPSGALVLMFTNSNSWGRKHPISIALSTDEGKTWPVVRDLQNHFHKGGCRSGCEYSYPAMLWSPGRCDSPAAKDPTGKGALHMSYTYSRRPMRRVAIRYLCVNDPEAWIRGGPPSKGQYAGPSSPG